MSWRLADVDERRRKNPGQFEVPELANRRSLSIGDSVKLIFELVEPISGCVGERMWVKVDKLLPEYRYRGVLQSVPVVVDGLAHGDTVEFGPEHIAAMVQK